MSGRFAEIILSVCMLLAVELGGFDVEIGTGGYTETPPGWDQELPSGETAGGNTPESEGDTPGSGGDTAEPEGNLSGWTGPEGNQGSQSESGGNWSSQTGSGGAWSGQTESGGAWSGQTGSEGSGSSQTGSEGAWGSQTGSDGNGNIQAPPEDGGSAGQQDNQESWNSAFPTAAEPSDASLTSVPEPSPILTLSPEPASSPTPEPDPTPTLTPEPSSSPSPEPSPAADVNESSDLSRSAVRPGRLMYWKGETEAAEELYLVFRFIKEPEILSLRVNGLEADWERKNGRIVIRTCSRENRNHVELAVFTEYPWTEGGNRVILTGNSPAAENN